MGGNVYRTNIANWSRPITSLPLRGGINELRFPLPFIVYKLLKEISPDHQEDTIVWQYDNDFTLHVQRSLAAEVGLPQSWIFQRIA